MNLSVVLNSKFGVALAIAAPFAVPLTALAIKDPKSACEVLNNIVDTFKAKVASLKGSN